MRIEKTDWGKRIFIKNDDLEQEYSIWNVRQLNSWLSRIHPCMDELEAREKKIERKLLILLFQFENCLKAIYAEPCGEFIERWEKHNRMPFNEWFHDQIRELISAIDDVADEYCIIAGQDGYGWCF